MSPKRAYAVKRTETKQSTRFLRALARGRYALAWALPARKAWKQRLRLASSSSCLCWRLREANPWRSGLRDILESFKISLSSSRWNRQNVTRNPWAIWSDLEVLEISCKAAPNFCESSALTSQVLLRGGDALTKRNCYERVHSPRHPRSISRGSFYELTNATHQNNRQRWMSFDPKPTTRLLVAFRSSAHTRRKHRLTSLPNQQSMPLQLYRENPSIVQRRFFWDHGESTVTGAVLRGEETTCGGSQAPALMCVPRSTRAQTAIAWMKR